MMKKTGWLRKCAAFLVTALALWMIFSPTSAAMRALPDTFRLSIGQSCAFEMGAAVLSSQDESMLALRDNTLSALEKGETEVSVNLFGLFQIGRMRVKVDDEMRLIPGGQAVGVALATKGVLVVGVSDIDGKSPAQAAGLKAGDVIETVNGQEVKSSEELTQIVSAGDGKALEIAYERNGAVKTALLTPMRDASSGIWRIGAWVRDSTAGVGTLSFYDPQNGVYGALGHAINDGDTGKLLPVRMGSLMKAEIVDIRRGQKGTPGELRGVFLRDQVILGDIGENTVLGIYGKLSKPAVNPLYPEGVPVGYQESVELGPATILSTIDGNGIRAYSVEIIQAARQLTPNQKSMVIRVTDPVLLEKTGGIVQGMSGSPILQNGHIIGAVTHVFVDDPTRGYGLYIEWMLPLSQAQEERDQAA